MVTLATNDEPQRRSAQALLKLAPPLLSLALLVVALWVLHTELAELSGDRLAANLESLPWPTLAIALALTVASYLLLGVNEFFGLRYAGKPLPFARAAHVSFVSYSFAHNVGLNLLTGGSIRYRMYAGNGLTALDVAAVTLYCSVAFGIGSLALAGVALLAEPQSVLMRLGTTQTAIHPLGVLALGGVAAYFILSLVLREPLRLWSWSIALPEPAFAASQIAVGALDMITSAAIVYILMPSDLGMGFAAFAGIYTIATWAGLLSHVPGGAGVFEAVMILLLPNVPRDELVASLLAYRAIYYVAPLMAAAATIAVTELKDNRDRLGRLTASIEQRVAPVLAPLIGLLVFLGGIVLLLSGATPAIDSRMSLLKAVLPLPLIEFSHLIGSISGTALLVLSRGLFRRLDGAYFVTAFVLAAGILVSILKGLDYEEAIVLSVILLLLLMSRSAFYRRSSLLAEPFSWGWIASIAAAVLGTTWVGLFAYRDVAYANDLWLNFAFEGDAERFLRASVVVAVVIVGFAVFRLTRPRWVSAPLPAPEDVGRAATVAAACDDTLSQLVTMGDKSILFSPTGKSFLMWTAHGETWVALGAPFGDPVEARDLAWRFREMCDQHDARPVFYQIAADALPLCLDLGLSIIKLGEEAHVPLDDFSLEGKKGRDLRLARNRAIRDGLSFAVLPRNEVAAHIVELQAVSDAWLATQNAAEKGFSLGSFAPEYVCQFDCAVVRREGRIVAFANILATTGKSELSIDLMRHAGGTHGAMDFLFAELMLWGRAQGYRWFNLGMAPLSGLESRPLAPLWHRAGALIFRHGEAFYNFKGLRQFKEKFNPDWHPRFLAFPGGLSLPYVLLDVSALVSGGLKEIVSK